MHYSRLNGLGEYIADPTLKLIVKPISVLFALACLAFADLLPDKSLGTKTAPILIDLFSDFQCPSCKMLHDQTLVPVIADYVNKGKVVLVYHDFPMPMHNHAREAARWANAAAAVHKYREVGDAFLRTQDSWARTGDPRAVVGGVLTQPKMKQVDALMKDPRIDGGIDMDVAITAKAGVQGAPTMVLTHKLQTDSMGRFISCPIFKQMLDEIAAQ